MHMGVVSRPYPEHSFDGKIDLLSVLEEHVHPKNLCREKFANDPLTNDAIVNGWRSLAFNKISYDVLLQGTADECDLDEHIAGNF